MNAIVQSSVVKKNTCIHTYIYIYNYIYKQLNRDLLNESFHVCAEHSTIIRSITPDDATIKSDHKIEKCVGLTEGTFKRRLYGHRQSFKNSNLKNATELSKHIWHLKENNEEYELSWRIIDKAKPYNRSSNKCSICLLEKYRILMRSDLLSSRSELVSKCRHRRSHLIGSVK